MGNPKIHDRLEVLVQSCDPFIFIDVLAGFVVLPGCSKDRQDTLARQRLIAATANEELMGRIRQVNWGIRIQILHQRRCQYYSKHSTL